MKKLIDKLDFFKKWKPFALQKTSSGLPSGSVVTNLPGNAGDMGSIPGPGRSHMHGGSQAHVPRSPRSTKRGHRNEKLTQRN